MYSAYSFPGASAGKEFAHNAGNLGSIPGLGRSPEEGNSYPLQYSGLENYMDCIVLGVAKSQTQLSDFHSLFHIIYLQFIKYCIANILQFKKLYFQVFFKNKNCLDCSFMFILFFYHESFHIQIDF